MEPKHQAAATGTNPSIERVVVAYEAFMHRLMATHAPEVNEIDITMAQAKALYLVLAQTQPTEEQRLWLSTVVEGLLR